MIILSNILVVLLGASAFDRLFDNLWEHNIGTIAIAHCYQEQLRQNSAQVMNFKFISNRKLCTHLKLVTDGFEAIKYKKATSLLSRVRSSNNSILGVIAQKNG